VPFPADELRQSRSELVDRILRELRIGDVPLHAVHGEPGAERAAAPDLDGVPDRLLARGLADDAPVDTLVARGERFDDAPGAIDGRSLFVARDEESERPAVRGMLPDESLGGRDH